LHPDSVAGPGAGPQRATASAPADDDAANVLAGQEISVAVVYLLQAVAAGDDLVEPEVPGLDT
jgi:hypothetical protein